MPRPPLQTHALKLTQAQRRAVDEVLPALADRLKADSTKPVLVRLTDAELTRFVAALDEAVRAAESGTRRNSLRMALDAGTEATALAEARRATPAWAVKITLLGTRPRVWRTIVIDDCTLGELHYLIQNAMGWEDCHMHDFRLGKRRFGDPRAESGDEDESKTKLSKLLPLGKDRFIYQYDFGDSWEHELKVTPATPAEAAFERPACLGGELACPPEDCGGAMGYADLLNAVENPAGDAAAELLEVYGDYDPAAFDPAAATERLRGKRPRR